MKKLLLILIVFSTFFICVSCSKTDALTVVSISSLNGNIFPLNKDSLKIGGFSLISSKLNEIRSESKSKLEIIGNSNFIYGTSEAYFTTGKAVIELMNELKFSCLVIGHREFYFGFEELKNLSKTAEFPFISANLVHKDSSRVQFIKPYLILNDNKTAVIGISASKVIKANLEKDVNMIMILDPAESVLKYVKELKSKGIENFVVVGDFDCNAKSSSNLTDSELRGLFAIEDLKVYLTTTENSQLCNYSKNKPVLNCSINGSELVSFKIKSGKISDLNTYPVNSKTTVPDMKLSNKMAKIDQMIEAITGKILGNLLDDIDHSQGDKFTSETPLGDLICDIMREYANTDIFIMNSGKVRRGLEKGPVTLGDLYAIIPYEGNTVTIEMTGEQIITILESSCAMKMSKSFLQVSGIKFTYDSSKKPFQRVVQNSIKVNGKSLDKNRVYTVSLTDYIYQGGDSYNEFKDMGVKLIETHQKQMREIVKDYIISTGTIKIHENNRIIDISKL